MKRIFSLLKRLTGNKPTEPKVVYLRAANLKSLNWLNPNMKFSPKDYFLAHFKEGKYQALTKKYEQWNYGTWSEFREIEKVLNISAIPSEWWLTIEKDGRPENNSIVLLSYGGGHYEVAKYNNFTWVTELSFPVKFEKYLIIKTPENDRSED